MYPRLIQRYGGNVVYKDMIKPCRKSRSHALVGTGTYEKYGLQLNYKTTWKKCLNARSERIKPERDVQVKEPCTLFDVCADRADVSMRKSIAKSLQSLRQPQFHEFYDFTDAFGNRSNLIIGEGCEGTVRCASRRQTDPAVKQLTDWNPVFAVKSINKLHSHRFRAKDNPIMREVTTLQSIGVHPHIIKLFDVYESPVRLHIVSEYLAGGDLYNYMSCHDFNPEQEVTVRSVVKNLLSAIKHCHDHEIVHLDIKLENIMRRASADFLDPSDTVLIDFGHSKKLPNAPTPTGLPYGTLSRPGK